MVRQQTDDTWNRKQYEMVRQQTDNTWNRKQDVKMTTADNNELQYLKRVSIKKGASRMTKKVIQSNNQALEARSPSDYNNLYHHKVLSTSTNESKIEQRTI